jgi:Flp pilus assembly protein TadG
MRDPSSEMRASGERGAALLLFIVLTLLVVLPLIGLAIDGGIAYFAQSRITSAVDAAALAGARSLNVGEEFNPQTTPAKKIAVQYFYANFPNGFLNSTNTNVPDPDVELSDTHTITVSMQASTDVQLYFMPILGHPTAHLSASAVTSRRDANVILALDRSGSMAGVCGVLRDDAENFVSRFVDTRDQLGLVTFMGSANLDFEATKTFKSGNPSLTDTLQQLNCSNQTGSADALRLAHEQITKINEPTALNVIVFFTDGVPNGFTAQFPLIAGSTCYGYIANSGGIYDATPQPIDSVTGGKQRSDCPKGSETKLGDFYKAIPEVDFWGNSARGYTSLPDGPISFSTSHSNAVSMNAAEDAASKARKNGIIIYTIGLGSNGGVDKAFLQRVANDPAYSSYNSAEPGGKFYYSPNASQLNAAFQSIASDILRISQ